MSCVKVARLTLLDGVMCHEMQANVSGMWQESRTIGARQGRRQAVKRDSDFAKLQVPNGDDTEEEDHVATTLICAGWS